MQVAIDSRTVDASHLLYVSAGRIACSLGRRAMMVLAYRIQEPLAARIRRWYGVRLFHARARLDLPTYETTNVQRQLDSVSGPEFGGSTVAFVTLETAATFIRAGTQVVAQCFALLRVLGGHRDGFLLCAITLLCMGGRWLSEFSTFQPARGVYFWKHLVVCADESCLRLVWAATTTKKDYVKMEGWRRVIGDVSHRKEVVAGNLGEYASSGMPSVSASIPHIPYPTSSRVQESLGQGRG